MSDAADLILLPDGTPIRMGYNRPDELRFGAVPAWDEANEVLAEDDCPDHDDYAPFCEPVKTQHFNNCTNASLAWLGKTEYLAAGVDSVPDLSMSYLYALNNGGRDQGAMCRDLAADFKRKGLPSAALWPESKVILRSEPPAEVVADAMKHVALEIYQCLDWTHVRSALARRFLVYHGFVLGNAFFKTGPDGKVPAWDGQLANGHAMGSRGLTRKFGNLRAITPNTWGPSFGAQGIGYIDKSYFWAQRGNYVNLDAYAIRAVKRTDHELPQAA